MDITRINVHLVDKEDSKLRAVASVTIQDAIAIHGIKVIEGANGQFIAMPARKTKENEFKDVAHPINVEARKQLESAILQEYNRIK